MLKPAWLYQLLQARPSFPFITAITLGFLGVFLSTGIVAPVLAGEETTSNVFLLDHLVAYWNFDENFDATIGGEKFDADPSSSPPRIDDIQSKFGGASAYFIHTNDEYLVVKRKVITQGQDHSYSAWYRKSHDIEGTQRFFVLETRNVEGTDGYSISYGLRDDGSQDVYQALTESSAGQVIGVGGGGPADNNWHNVVVTYDADNTGAEHTFYLDGVFQNTAATSPELMDTAGLVIGGHRGGEGRNFWGWIDDVAIWDRVLTPEEVAAIQTRPILEPAPYPDLTMGLQATIPYEGGYAQGEAYCYLGEGNTVLTDPVIVVEGFDPDNTNTRDKLYYRLNTQDLLVEMQAEGFDAVVLNYDSGADYIQRNAMLLVELITRVRDQIPERKDMVVIGASMGGLVSRYALAYMETQGIDHRVRTFISFDSPQKVANIPIGIQGLVDFVAAYGFDSFQEEAQEKLDMLRMPAAEQMLGWHIDAATFDGHPLRQQLYADLASLGDYPQALKKVAIANGSGTVADQGFGDSARLMHAVIGNPTPAFIGVYALPGPTVFRVEVLGDDIYIRETTPGATSWDRAPGGFRDTANAAVKNVGFEWEVLGVPIKFEAGLFADEPNHCFIPTISALDLNTSEPFFNIAETDPATLLSMTPFDAVHFPAENQDHVSVTTENKDWFMDEIRRPDPVSDVDDLPEAVASRPLLRAVYPNPFNPQTTVTFDLPRPDVASVKVYDVAGRLIATLADEYFGAGSHKLTWTGKDGGGRDVAAGIYFCRLAVGQDLQVRRMALIK